MESGVKTVLITSNGDEVSKSIALHLARMGFSRLVLMGDEKCLKGVAEEIREARLGRVEVIGLDMEEESEGPFIRAVHNAFTAFPNSSLDAFVHCFSYQGKSQNHLELPESEFKKIVKVNLTAPWHLLNAVARRMRDNGSGGSIVLLTSIVGAERGIYPGSAAYAACSAALLQLARVSALEIGKYKIRVNAIARGLHMGDEYLESVGKERAQRLVNEAAPLARWLDPKNDINSTVVYLINDGSKYMTGTTIFVDGAQSITRPRFRSYM